VLPASLLTDLAEFWPFDEGSGSTAHGLMGELDLALTANHDTVADCWNTPGSDNQFGGYGSGSIPAGWAMLENVGDACTIGVDTWYGGWQHTVTPQDAGQAASGSDEFVRIDGEYVLSLAISAAIANPPPQDPSFNTHIYAGQGVGAGNGVDTFINQPPFASTAPYTMLVELVRVTTTDVRCRIYAAGAQKQDDGVYAWDPHQATLRIGGGSAHGIRAAAVWLRVLTESEITAIATAGSLATLPDAGDPPLVSPTGGSSVALAFPGRRMDTSVTLASEGPMRHTRAVHEHPRRRYRLPLPNATPGEVMKVLMAVRNSRGGAVPVAIRVPPDDPLNQPAPRYRILNAGLLGDLEITRFAGGSAASLELNLEEV